MGIKEPDVLMFLERIYTCQTLAKIEWNLICNWFGKSHRSIPTKWLHPSNYPISTYSLWYLDTFEPSKFYLLFIYIYICINHVYNILYRCFKIMNFDIFQDFPRFSKIFPIISQPPWPFALRPTFLVTLTLARRCGSTGGRTLRSRSGTSGKPCRSGLGKEVDLDPPS